MIKQQLKEYCEAEFENIDTVVSELFSVVSAGKSDYLSFRHFFVHSYSFTLKWEELKPLVDGIEETLARFKSAIYDFIDKHA